VTSRVTTGLDDPGLARLWDEVAARLQRNGLAPRGTLILEGLHRSERHALAGLIGSPVIEERARVDLAKLDARLRAVNAAPGLVAAVASLRGPLVDRRSTRAAARSQRAAVWEQARAALASYGLVGEPWIESWFDSARAVVGRIAVHRAGAVLETAVRCVARLPWDGDRCGRTELASRIGGGSHALDDGTVLAALVLRAIAAALGEPPAETPAQRRALWERAGVQVDEVSITVLTLGLRPAGSSAVAGAVRARSDAGCEAHLTLRDLRRVDGWVGKGTVVWVCENPRVLEAAMDAGTDAVVVCTAGNPTVVVTTLLERLVAKGAELHYRGDFDWAGLGIANRIVTTYHARPWRMGTADYEAALVAAGAGLVELPPLEGRSVEAVWDEELAPTMRKAGKAIHEEVLLDLLVADLVV
jgi:uncharacterized protein (TIGR02679 family)